MKLSNRKLANPFIYQGYESPEYFCDREAETATLLSHLKNGRNVTLISPHRIGKTGLIKNAFFYLEEEENDTVCLTELMFTDNDELSGLIARMWRMPALGWEADVVAQTFVIPGLTRDPAFLGHQPASRNSGTPDQVRGDDDG